MNSLIQLKSYQAPKLMVKNVLVVEYYYHTNRLIITNSLSILFNKILNPIRRSRPDFSMRRTAVPPHPYTWDRGCPKASRLGCWDTNGTALSQHIGCYLVSMSCGTSRWDMNPRFSIFNQIVLNSSSLLERE